ncbi:MAG: PaREP1 family protein [Methanophagales archaeon]|nr:PaREP1 family protein [Methanophagales archaeon]
METNEYPHLELALRMFEDAKGCIEKEDAVQASEKLYKASEEALKVLAERFALREYVEAERKGRWSVALLFRAVRKLSEINPAIINFWDHAWTLHVEGFHEARLTIEDVKEREKFIEELVKIAKEMR